MLRHAARGGRAHRGTGAAGAGRRAGAAVRGRRRSTSSAPPSARSRSSPTRRAVMREVFRVLRPGGRWVFSVTHPMRWIFLDDPGEGGLVAVHSYFDRRPYVEHDADRRAHLRRAAPHARRPGPRAGRGRLRAARPGRAGVAGRARRDLGPVEPAARPPLPRHRHLRHRPGRNRRGGTGSVVGGVPVAADADRDLQRDATAGRRRPSPGAPAPPAPPARPAPPRTPARRAPAAASGSAGPASRSAASTRSIATLMMSAAEPWIGALSAIRSAISRRCRLSLIRSGR